MLATWQTAGEGTIPPVATPSTSHSLQNLTSLNEQSSCTTSLRTGSTIPLPTDYTPSTPFSIHSSPGRPPYLSPLRHLTYPRTVAHTIKQSSTSPHTSSQPLHHQQHQIALEQQRSHLMVMAHVTQILRLSTEQMGLLAQDLQSGTFPGFNTLHQQQPQTRDLILMGHFTRTLRLTPEQMGLLAHHLMAGTFPVFTTLLSHHHHHHHHQLNLIFFYLFVLVLLMIVTLANLWGHFFG